MGVKAALRAKKSRGAARRGSPETISEGGNRSGYKTNKKIEGRGWPETIQKAKAKKRRGEERRRERKERTRQENQRIIRSRSGTA